MNNAEISTYKKIEWISLGLGLLSVLVVIINQSPQFKTLIFPDSYTPAILTLSLILISASFYCQIKPRLKRKDFYASFNYRKLLRLIGLVILVVYAWINN